MSSGRKLRPIMPRPLPSNSLSAVPSPFSHSLTPIQPSSCSTSCFLHKSNTLSTSADLPDDSKEFTARTKQDEHAIAAASSVTTSTPSRWNPTAEQLRALEDMYEGGTRTPTADQIKLIAGRLSRFGKIEGKNVFYWFQNHKARERHKRRCRYEHRGRSLETEEPAGFQVGQTKNNAASNCSTNSEYSVSTTHRAVEASETRAPGWIQLEERELLQQIRRRRTKNTQSNHATWQPMEPSSAPQAFQFMATVRRTAPEEALNLSLNLAPSNRDMNVIKLEERGNPQTLQLFPIRNCDRKAEKMVHEVSMASIDTGSFVPCQFFEFLPMKN